MSWFTGLDLVDATGLHYDVALRVTADGAEIAPRTGQSGTDLSRDGLRALVTQGLVDLQVNGGAGQLLGAFTTAADLHAMDAAHWATGTAALLPTLVSDRPEVTRRVIDLVAAAQETCPAILGLHLEGPHLAVAGAHDPAILRPIGAEDLALYIAARTRLGVLMITLAPEMVTPDQIRALSDAGVIVSLGHTACDYDMACTAFDAGAQMSTHLFNAMSGLHHRNPGLVGATLERAMPYGLIADGVHVHPTTLKIALAAHETGAVLVSDAMALTGSAADRFTLAGREVHRRNGRLELADGTLAGADLTLVKAVENVADWTARDIAETAQWALSRPLQLVGTARHPTPSRWLIWHEGRASARIDAGAVLPLALA
ncbi:N-acetylglucosamine-6-phosphate deacetylase [Roseicyclus sp.]|uniref:N-acetylglucosamine-6-phosphate deacetylase n=1 Tax=Roseicyclus sp. TaxID=1914329 RepID=UPI003F6D790D